MNDPIWLKATKQIRASLDIAKFGSLLDYQLATSLGDIIGFSHEADDLSNTNKTTGDSARLVIHGATRPYVTDFAKRNNMGYAMCATVMGLSEKFIRKAPNFVSAAGGKIGATDDRYAIASYNAGIALATNTSLIDVMDQYGRSMQPPSMRISKEWPDPVELLGLYIWLNREAYNALIALYHLNLTCIDFTRIRGDCLHIFIPHRGTERTE